MHPTLTLCLSREAHHRELSAAATLDNVRRVADAAAAAWAKEGMAAAGREARAKRVRVELPSADHRQLSANPDRGFADGG
ncbi:hypothetical protein FBR43_07335 [Sphingomonas baiyangensis]|uniref:Uncharacterized protein n=1 Tax=Sphingomonas baiyangensis TaxID=2572576 RepID=A0A4U1L1C2_9SPHN|nr:hypothetical protein FBR43_07335 [Sphingomonas baiyangensis]